MLTKKFKPKEFQLVRSLVILFIGLFLASCGDNNGLGDGSFTDEPPTRLSKAQTHSLLGLSSYSELQRIFLMVQSDQFLKCQRVSKHKTDNRFDIETSFNECRTNNKLQQSGGELLSGDFENNLIKNLSYNSRNWRLENDKYIYSIAQEIDLEKNNRNNYDFNHRIYIEVEKKSNGLISHHQISNSGELSFESTNKAFRLPQVSTLIKFEQMRKSGSKGSVNFDQQEVDINSIKGSEGGVPLINNCGQIIGEFVLEGKLIAKETGKDTADHIIASENEITFSKSKVQTTPSHCTANSMLLVQDIQKSTSRYSLAR